MIRGKTIGAWVSVVRVRLARRAGSAQVGTALAGLALVGLAACGSSQEAPKSGAQGDKHDHHEHGHGHGHEHGHGHGEAHHGGHGEGHHGQHKHDFKGGMKAFHDMLAPAYHMDKGQARNDKACAATTSMREAAKTIAGEPVGDAAAWKAKSGELATSVEALDKACQAKAEVEQKLESLHDAFHAVMKLGGM